MNKPNFAQPVKKAIAVATLCAMNVTALPASYAGVKISDGSPNSGLLSTTNQDIVPISFDEILGVDENSGDTLFIDVDSDDFVLSQDQWYLIQAYVHSAFELPTTEAAMKSALRFTDTLEFNNDYRSLLGEYIEINESATQWNSELYPSIVDLALQLANYSDIHLVFFQPLVDTLNELVNQAVELKGIGQIFGEDSGQYIELAAEMDTNLDGAKNYLNLLTIFSESRLTAVEETKTNLLNFATALKEQSISLDVYSELFHDVLNQDNTEQLRDRIDEINDRIQQINDEIAKKKRDVGLTAIGGGISLLIGGSILGAQIKALKEEAKELRNELDGLEGDLAHAIAVYESYSAATISIGNIDEKIEAALPHIETLKLHWQNMRREFDDMKVALDASASEVGLENLDILLGSVTTTELIGIAEGKWSTISTKAKEFVQNAYVVIE